MLDVEVIEDATAASAALDPIRIRILSELAQPASAAILAGRLGIARQKVNYHLRELEKNGLARVAEERKWGGLTERLMVATAATYVVSPAAMGSVASDPCRCQDRLSARYLIALGARIVQEITLLLRRSADTGKRLATLSIDTEIRFRSAAERAAFTEELTRSITQLAARYHDETAIGGRAHRLVIVAHPLPGDSGSKKGGKIMSVKQEPSGRRSVQVEVEVPGTPEEVWRAISTGPGISSWFVPTEMDQHAGGKITMHFGPGMDAVATITAWEPNVRFAAESNHLGENAPAFATEWFVEARSGGVCVVRVVHSLFTESADWDGELEGTESGWPIYFRVLRLYLRNFAGKHGKSMVAMGSSSTSEAETWKKLSELLGIKHINEGQPIQTGTDAPRLSGTVEWDGHQKTPPSLILLLNEPAPGVAIINASNCGGSVLLSLSLYLHGDNATDVAAKQQSKWQDWMNQHFPTPVPPTQ